MNFIRNHFFLERATREVQSRRSVGRDTQTLRPNGWPYARDAQGTNLQTRPNPLRSSSERNQLRRFGHVRIEANTKRARTCQQEKELQ